jgi:hypothetical protein
MCSKPILEQAALIWLDAACLHACFRAIFSKWILSPLTCLPAETGLIKSARKIYQAI